MILGVGSGKCIYFWKYKDFSDQRTNCSITPELSYFGNKISIKFNGSCLKEDKITYTHGKIVNLYIVYEISRKYNIGSYPTL